jgi:hypothetical protein
MSLKSTTIGFRMTMPQVALIDQARIPLGLSRGEWAKGVVLTELLASQRRDEVREQLATLMSLSVESEDGLRKLHTNLARVLYVMLTAQGIDADEARAIIRSNLIT